MSRQEQETENFRRIWDQGVLLGFIINNNLFVSRFLHPLRSFLLFLRNAAMLLDDYAILLTSLAPMVLLFG